MQQLQLHQILFSPHKWREVHLAHGLGALEREDVQRLLLAFNLDKAGILEKKGVLSGMRGTFTRDNFARACVLLQARRHIHGITGHKEVATGRVAGSNDFTCVDPHA